MAGALTRIELEDAMYESALLCLESQMEDAHSRVRISWPVHGEGGDMPGWARGEDVCFLRAQHFSDSFTRLSEAQYEFAPNGEFRESRSYVRGHEVKYIFYGERAMENAEALRTGILSKPVRAFLWDSYALAPLSHIAEAVRADEWFGGAWWCRYDVTVRFYEGAGQSTSVEPIAASPDIRLIGG